jgi:hypothetical protein
VISPDERHRRSERAKELHRAGKLGSKAVARRAAIVRHGRNADLAKRLAGKHAAKIEAVLVDSLTNGTRSQKLRAAEALLKYSLQSSRLGLDERKGEAAMSRDEAVTFLAERLTQSQTALILRRRLEGRANGAIEGSAVDIGQ